MESFSEKANKARVAQGFKEGPFFKNGVPAPKRTFVDAVPQTVVEKFDASNTPKENLGKTFSERKGN